MHRSSTTLHIVEQEAGLILGGLPKLVTAPGVFAHPLGKLLPFWRAEPEREPVWCFAPPVIPLFCRRLQRTDPERVVTQTRVISGMHLVQRGGKEK